MMKTGKSVESRGLRVKGNGMFWKQLVWLVTLFSLASTLHCLYAAEPQISAALDRDQITLNEQAVLNVTVSGGGNLPSPQMPALPDFQIVNTQRAQNFSWINGQASASVIYGYAITPLKEGTFTIPPIHLEGSAAQTAPLTLHVLKGDAAAIPSAPGAAPTSTRSSAHGPAAIFIRGTVDKSSVYVGEPVTYAFRLYNRVPLFSRPNYQPPQTSGFWTEDLPQKPGGPTTVDGLPYNMTELKTILFPTGPGTARIGPAQLSVTIENLGSDPFSQNFFAQFFGRAEEKTLHTEPITVHVKPLPDPKPVGFEGAVGKFSISSNLDKTSVTVGEPITLTITISGEGNIKSLPGIKLPAVTNFRMFDATAATNIEKNQGRVQGSKVYKTVMIPTASGDVRIPSVPFVYFDPDTRSYKTLESRSFPLRVLSGAGGNASTAQSAIPSAPASADSVSSGQIQRLSEDIHYIKTPGHLGSQGHFWIELPLFWIFHGLILLLLLGFGCFRLYQFYFLANNAWNRFKNAAPRAYDQARNVERLADDSKLKEAAVLLSDTYQRYLADKLSIPSHGMALKEAQEALRQRGLHSHDGEKIRNLWETLDLFEFAPTQIRTEDVRQALATFRHIVEEMEQEIKWEK